MSAPNFIPPPSWQFGQLGQFGKQFLELGDDAVLFGRRRNGNFAGTEIRRRYPALANDAGHVVLGQVAERPAGNEGITELRADARMRAQDVKRCRAEAKASPHPPLPANKLQRPDAEADGVAGVEGLEFFLDQRHEA
ncbi:MAG: hypothetical protein H6R15_1333 [Proteobacteria bacterium]|nr:hypothetical protein [Pseudomonadota bacterium]